MCSTLKEKIIEKYNSCVGYINSPIAADAKSFNGNLNALNNMLFSSYVDDSNMPAELYYYVAEINFKVHNYQQALRCIEKSIKQERIFNLNIEIGVGFHKRLLQALCYEYLGLGIDYNASKRLPFLNTAIKLLIGKGVEDFESNSDILKGIIKWYDEYRGEYLQVLEHVSNSDNENLFSYLKNNEVATGDHYDQMFRELSHTLSHCLNEYYISSPIANREFNKALVFISRLSEFLMKAIGDDFVTCYATLKVEKNEMLLALDELKRVRRNRYDRMISLDSTESSEYLKAQKEVALIDYYTWYFSIRSNIGGHETWSLAFKEYCTESNDSIANTYYNILYFKNLLYRNFESIKNCRETNETELHQAYKELVNTPPTPFIHKSIAQEWDFLCFAKDIYDLCECIRKTEIVYTFYELQQKLYKYYKTNRPTEAKLERGFTIKNRYCIVEVNGGSFLYKGSEKTIIKKLHDQSIGVKSIVAKSVEHAMDYGLKKFSTVLVAGSTAFLSEDIDFVLKICKYDQNKTIADSHIIYFDTSSLTDDEINEVKDTFNNEALEAQGKIVFINNYKVGIDNCVTYALLEGFVARLARPICDLVIDPVEDTESFISQDCSNIQEMDIAKINQMVEKNSLSWKNNFPTCFCLVHRENLQRKKIDFSQLRVSGLTHIIEFNYDSRSAYVFSRSNSDIVDRLRIVDNNLEIFTSLKRLYNKFKNGQRNCHTIDCTNNECFSVFTSISASESTHQDLRELLYSYLGLMMEDASYILLRKKIEDSSSMDYVLCVFDNHNSLDEQAFCRTIQQIPTIITDYHNGGIEYKRPLSVLEKEKQIQKYNGKGNYFFISYKSRGGSKYLCVPVYDDCIRFNSIFQYVIDVANFYPDFKSDIEKYINDTRCIGALVYLSPQYLNIGDAGDDDMCLKEMELINMRCREDHDFQKQLFYVEGSLEEDAFAKLNNILTIEEYISRAGLSMTGEAYRHKIAIYNEFFAYDEATRLYHPPTAIIRTLSSGDHLFNRNFQNWLGKLDYKVGNKK